jgi:hypothetical protein
VKIPYVFNDLRIPCRLQKILKAVFDQDSQRAVYPSRSRSCEMVDGEGRTCQGPSWPASTIQRLLERKYDDDKSVAPTINYLQVAVGLGLGGHTEV